MKTDSKPDTDSLARALDDEFKRIARLEDVPMLDLVTQVAGSLGCSERQLYNYRSGKWPLPSSFLPALCQRFNSTLLLDVLHTAIPIEISPTIDVDAAWLLSKHLIQKALDHSDTVQKALGLGCADFTRGDLARFSELTDSMIRDCQRLRAFVEAAYDHEQEQRRLRA